MYWACLRQVQSISFWRGWAYRSIRGGDVLDLGSKSTLLGFAEVLWIIINFHALRREFLVSLGFSRTQFGQIFQH
jgi:hypothetical protein